MKELTLSTMIAVFEEVFGSGLFWALVVLAALGLAAFLFILARERSFQPGRFIRSELLGIIGGFAAVWFVQMITSSGYSDIGGPVDLIIVMLIWLAGAFGTIMVAYTIQGFIFGKKAADPAE